MSYVVFIHFFSFMPRDLHHMRREVKSSEIFTMKLPDRCLLSSAFRQPRIVSHISHTSVSLTERLLPLPEPPTLWWTNAPLLPLIRSLIFAHRLPGFAQTDAQVHAAFAKVPATDSGIGVGVYRLQRVRECSLLLGAVMNTRTSPFKILGGAFLCSFAARSRQIKGRSWEARLSASLCSGSCVLVVLLQEQSDALLFMQLLISSLQGTRQSIVCH